MKREKKGEEEMLPVIFAASGEPGPTVEEMAGYIAAELVELETNRQISE